VVDFFGEYLVLAYLSRARKMANKQILQTRNLNSTAALSAGSLLQYRNNVTLTFDLLTPKPN